MGQRISRAKAKIVRAGIPFRVPPSEQLAERLDAYRQALDLTRNEAERRYLQRRLEESERRAPRRPAAPTD